MVSVPACCPQCSRDQQSCSALTQAKPRFLSNEGTHLADEERQLWAVPAVPATYPSSSAEVPMMEPWTSAFPYTLSTPNTPPYQALGFAYASNSDFPNSGLPSSFPGYDLPDDWLEFVSNPESTTSMPILTTWSRVWSIRVRMRSADERAGAHET